MLNGPRSVPIFLVTLTLRMYRFFWIPQRMGLGKKALICLKVLKHKYVNSFYALGQALRFNTLRTECPFYAEEKTHCSLLWERFLHFCPRQAPEIRLAMLACVQRDGWALRLEDSLGDWGSCCTYWRSENHALKSFCSLSVLSYYVFKLKTSSMLKKLQNVQDMASSIEKLSLVGDRNMYADICFFWYSSSTFKNFSHQS